MPSLREVQTAFLDALLAAELPGGAPFTAAYPEPAASRIRVHRSTVRSNFTAALRGSFPAVARLVGAESFAETALAFQRRQPSRSGDLLHVGMGFSGFLDELYRDGRFAYLSHVARLEWLIQAASLAAEHPPLDLAKLATVPPSAYSQLRFELHPSLRLFESEYPAWQIWEVNVDAAEPPIIDLDSGGDRLAIMRRGLQLQFHRLGVGELAFLTSLASRECFSTAVERAMDRDAAFDAPAALKRFVAAEAVVDCRVQA